jgi:hypothetical protein
MNNAAKSLPGSKHGRAKLTEVDVLAIREAARDHKLLPPSRLARRDPLTGRAQRTVIGELARQYRVSVSTISQIVARRVWRHI